MQVCGTLRFPLPSMSFSRERGDQQLALGHGTYEMRVDQVNPCIRF